MVRSWIEGRRLKLSLLAELPLESNIQFMTIMATKMPFIGRG